MRFGHIELAVSDPMAALAYYTGSLGFELVANQNDTFIWLKKDDVEFLLRPQGDYDLPCVVFYSEDPESHGVLRNGARLAPVRISGRDVSRAGTAPA